MKYILIFIFIFSTFLLHGFDAFKYFKKNNYGLVFDAGSRKYTFTHQKKSIKVVLQEYNNIFSIDKYYLHLIHFPYSLKGKLVLSKKDAYFLTNIIKKVEYKVDVKNRRKKELSLEKEIARLKAETIPSKFLAVNTSPVINYIFIDPGHGGEDPGSSAYGFDEKILSLTISKALRKALSEKLSGVKVILTRTSDVFLSLEKRCNIANSKLKKNENSLFVSVHLNRWFSPETSGFEVYYLSHNKNNLKERIAGVENGVFKAGKTNVKTMKMYKKIFSYINVIQYQKESKMLADNITFTVYKNMTNYVVNRGVKSDEFFVLKGALMPSILIETGFISNKKDLDFVTDNKKLQRLTGAIAEGIVMYVDEFKKTKGFSLELF